MDNSPPVDPKIFTVSELNSKARKLLEAGFGTIDLRGEVSGVTKSQAGHYYFSLKDEKAEIRCVLFASTVYRNKIAQKPEQGKEIKLVGRVTLYEPRGNYQFFVENIELELGTEGALYKKFLQLKKELTEKGYFRDEIKKQLPFFPKRVGIITSPTGAAVHDIIRAFKRRNPVIELRVYPVAVQGENAPREIASAIELANFRKDVNVLLLSRGGGSLEDLAAFNDPSVAEAIYTSDIPIVTGIGHQTDVSIADYVADKALATPTAAAEHISTPSVDQMLQDLTTLESKLHDEVLSKLNDLGQRVDLAQRSLIHPAQRIADLQNQFRSFQQRLLLLTQGVIADKLAKVNIAHQQLLNRSPAQTFEFRKQKLDTATETLYQTTLNLHDKYTARIDALTTQLKTMDPHATLNRGYAIVRLDSDQSIVADANAVSPGDRVNAQLAKGSLDLNVESVNS